MKKLLFVVFLAVAGGILIWGQPRLPRALMGSSEANGDQAAALEPKPAVEFPEDAEWLQSKPLKLSDLHGKVVIVHFWTFG